MTEVADLPDSSLASPAPVDDVLTIEEAAQYLKIGRTTMYHLITSGEVDSIYIGRLRRVPVECLRAYVRRLRGDVEAA